MDIEWTRKKPLYDPRGKLAMARLAEKCGQCGQLSYIPIKIKNILYIYTGA